MVSVMDITWRAYSSDKLVHGEVDSILVDSILVHSVFVLTHYNWVHVNLHIRSCSCIIPKGQGTILVQHSREGISVGKHSCDVGGCIQSTYQLATTARVVLQFLFQITDISLPILILCNPYNLEWNEDT